MKLVQKMEPHFTRNPMSLDGIRSETHKANVPNLLPSLNLEQVSSNIKSQFPPLRTSVWVKDPLLHLRWWRLGYLINICSSWTQSPFRTLDFDNNNPNKKNSWKDNWLIIKILRDLNKMKTPYWLSAPSTRFIARKKKLKDSIIKIKWKDTKELRWPSRETD